MSKNMNENNNTLNAKYASLIEKEIMVSKIIDMLKKDEIHIVTKSIEEIKIWSEIKMSRFIESIIIQFPLMPIYLHSVSGERLEVIDGFKRMYTLGVFIIPDNNGKCFRLNGLEYLPQFNGFNFIELPKHIQRIINKATITAYITKPGTPDAIKENIIKRLNT